MHKDSRSPVLGWATAYPGATWMGNSLSWSLSPLVTAACCWSRVAGGHAHGGGVTTPASDEAWRVTRPHPLGGPSSPNKAYQSTIQLPVDILLGPTRSREACSVPPAPACSVPSAWCPLVTTSARCRHPRRRRRLAVQGRSEPARIEGREGRESELHGILAVM
jgi:hypothetical protein